MSYSNDAQGSRSRRRIQHQNSYDKMTKNISDVSQAGGAAIATLGAVGIGVAVKAKNTTTKPRTNQGLKGANTSSIKGEIRAHKVYDRLHQKLDSYPSNKNISNNRVERMSSSYSKYADKGFAGKTPLSKGMNSVVKVLEAKDNMFGKRDVFGRTRPLGIVSKAVPALRIASFFLPKKMGNAELRKKDKPFIPNSHSNDAQSSKRKK